jgi:phosphatidylethanolamine-binding protein (PEBP) family uncharacterized protein
VPDGAIVGRNDDGKIGYSLCPEDGGETYIVTVYALPEPLHLKAGFSAAELHKKALAESGSAGLLSMSYDG